jgi:hypothetical protein
MYVCVTGIDFASFYYVSTGIWNCSDSVFFFSHFVVPVFQSLSINPSSYRSTHVLEINTDINMSLNYNVFFQYLFQIIFFKLTIV